VLPSISVSGNHFVDGTGNTIRLLGVNRSGSEYMCTGGGSLVFDGPSTDASITAMASWHINAVRLGLNEDCWLGINGFPASMTASAYQMAIVDYVNRLHLQGMYAILELHWNAPGTQQSTGQQVMVDADHGTAFWTSVANTFKGDSKVLFDLYNEPQGISWACLRDGCTAGSQTVGMQSLVNTVRSTGATNPILVGGIGYAGDLSQWLAFKPTDPDNAIVASFHTYDFVGNCTPPPATGCGPTLLPIAAVVPLVTGELGETDCAHGYIDAYMPWADTNGISYLGWAWDTNGCNSFPSLISNYDGTPTNFGIGFRDHLAALASSTSPTVTSVSPNSGLPAGGTSVTISGTNFTGATAVKFGTTAATFTFNSATQITATSPAGTGTVDVTVTAPSGTSPTNTVDQFTYTGPPPTVTMLAPTGGPAVGGTSVVITGTNLSGATAVKFGTAAATALTANTATRITATSPAGSGTVDVAVTTPSGTSATTTADKFTYTPAPTVVSVAPNNGPTGGGTSVVIMGTNLSGATAVKFGTAAATALTGNTATQITATSPAGSGTVDVTVTTPGGSSATSAADRFAYTLPPAAYTAVTPVRLLDTRNGGGALGPAAARSLTVAGVTPGAPPGATAVVLNVTVTNTTAPSYLTVYPAGSSPPLASSLNWVAGETIANLVTVQVGTASAITIFNGAGSTDVVVDLEGYFAAPAGTAGGEVALTTPARITDTRAGSGQPNAGSTLGPTNTITVQVTGAGGVPTAGVSAAILNVTVTNTTAPSFLTIWPTNASRPTASNLNWMAGVTIPNRVIVPVSSLGQVSIYNASGSADVVVDISGYFTNSMASGKFFTPVRPQRIADTRSSLGCPATLAAVATCTLQVGGLSGVPSGASAVILNVTVTNTTAPSFLTVHPSTGALPLSSDLNWVGGQTIPNLVVATLGTTGAITFYNSAGSTDVVVDLAGWYS
jgi:Cellulase (glycosyl hydrolase family 5)/IPT/TIG domain